MAGPANVRFRDAFRKYIPPWLSDRGKSVDGKTVGFRFLWSMIAPLDVAVETLVQGLKAPWPGVGTPTAMQYIARTRGMIRGEAETDEDFAVRLIQWLDRWRAAGSAIAIATAIRDYCANHPRVRIITRAGYFVTLAADGTITRQQSAWDWDSISHPDRAGFWSEIFIVVYPTQWSQATGTWGDGGLWADSGLGIGHDVPRESYDAIKGLINQWKSAHTKVRAVVWTSDTALFDPDDPGTGPNGEWGSWGSRGATRIRSDREYSVCRYWEM